MSTCGRDTTPAALSINPSVLHSYPYLQDVENDEVPETHHSTVAPSFPPEPSDEVRPNIREQKLPLGKGFPFKLYFMLEDVTLKQYVSWTKSKGNDALSIPNIDAFIENVLPKHFEGMKKWGSFQKQLNNYDFRRQDRGPNKAIYAHPEFLQGRPELLINVRRRRRRRILASPGQKPPSTPRSLTPSDATPAPGVPAQPPSYNFQVEYVNVELKKTIEGLKMKLESSEQSRLSMDVRLRAAEAELRGLQQQVVEMGKQLKELLDKPERRSTGDGASNSAVEPSAATSAHHVDGVHGALIPSAAAGSHFSNFDIGAFLRFPTEPHLTAPMVYNAHDPLIGLGFLGP